jgi:hypothetical protein
VAYTERWLRDQLAAGGFDVRGVYPGRWRGGEGPTFQDVVIAERVSSVRF